MYRSRKEMLRAAKKNYPMPKGMVRLPGGTILYPPVRQPALHGKLVADKMAKRSRKRIPRITD